MSRSVGVAGALALACLLPSAGARGDRRRSRRNPRADPAIEGILRSAHSGARTAAEGSRSQCGQSAGRPRPRTARGGGRDRAGGGTARTAKHLSQRVQSGDLGGPARRLREPVAGPDEVRDRRLRSERRHRARQARVQHRGVGVGALRQRRRQGLRQSDLLALAREHRRGRGSVRHVHRAAVRIHAEVRSLPVEHRLPQRPAPARLGLLRRAAAVSGVSRRPVQERRPAAQMGRADRDVPRVRRRRSATARASPAPIATRTASAAVPRTSTPAAKSARATSGARDFRTCSCDRTTGNTRRPTSRATRRSRAFPARASSRSPTSSGNGRPTATR